MAQFKKQLTQAQALAKKYYHTDDLKTLQPYQLDKIITWVTKMNPDSGKSQQRKAETAIHNQRTDSNKYLNKKTKAQAITEKGSRLN